MLKIVFYPAGQRLIFQLCAGDVRYNRSVSDKTVGLPDGCPNGGAELLLPPFLLKNKGMLKSSIPLFHQNHIEKKMLHNFCHFMLHGAGVRIQISIHPHPQILAPPASQMVRSCCTACLFTMVFICSRKNSSVPFVKSIGRPYSDRTLQIWLKRSGCVSSLRISR